MLDDGLGFLEFDPDGRITRASGGVLGLLGTPTVDSGRTASLEGLAVTDLPGLTPPTWTRLLLGAEAGPSFDFVWRDAPEGGRTCIRLDLQRQADGAGALRALDLTAMLNGAPPVQISLLSSEVSHELRNPLSSVKMAVQTLARNAGLSERDQRRLAIANREVRTLERMLWLLSEYGRLSTPHPEAVPLHAVVDEARQLVAPELAERGVTIALDPASEALTVQADRARTRVVLGQLFLTVALGETGTQTLELALVERGESHTTLGLRDRSARLAPGEREMAFEPFRSALSRGAGLGLATLAAVMRQQGGAASLVDLGDDGAQHLLHFPNA